MKLELDERDRLLIWLVDEGQKRGVGRTFETKNGQRVKVLDIDGEWIRFGVGPGYATEIKLTRKIREFAQKVAMLQGRISN